ncbi:MAG TPA: hypothetical protein VFF66_10825 [Brevundimonas sp.]|nr:hypothetical protein [Brevundimonas sp.]
MRTLSPLRVLTPAGWGLLAVALVIVVAVLGHGLGLRWDPFGLTGRRLRAAEAQAAAAVSDAVARGLETEGMAEQARRLEHHHQQAVAIEQATAVAAAQAGSAHDASIPLDPARADRLLRHDRELCRLAPAVCGAAAIGPATGGDAALRPAAPA